MARARVPGQILSAISLVVDLLADALISATVWPADERQAPARGSGDVREVLADGDEPGLLPRHRGDVADREEVAPPQPPGQVEDAGAAQHGVVDVEERGGGRVAEGRLVGDWQRTGDRRRAVAPRPSRRHTVRIAGERSGSRASPHHPDRQAWLPPVRRRPGGDRPGRGRAGCRLEGALHRRRPGAGRGVLGADPGDAGRRPPARLLAGRRGAVARGAREGEAGAGTRDIAHLRRAACCATLCVRSQRLTLGATPALQFLRAMEGLFRERSR